MRNYIAGLCTVLIVLVGHAAAATLTLSAATTTVDDAWVTTDVPDANYGGTGSIIENPNGYHPGLLGYKDMFTMLPPGGGIVIDSASMTLCSASAQWIKIYRTTSDWLVKPAGQNQYNVTAAHRDVAGGLAWAAGRFGVNDYDTVDYLSGSTSAGYNSLTNFDVTRLVSKMYSVGQNYGFAINSLSYIRSQEASAANGTPKLVISYHYALPGDANADGFVTFQDYIVLELNFGCTGTGFSNGDFNGDGKVDFKDYIVLESNFGRSVPEPASLLSLVSGACLLRRRP